MQSIIRLLFEVVLCICLCTVIELFLGFDFVALGAVKFGVNAAVNLVFGVGFIRTELRVGLDDGDFSRLDIHVAEARYSRALLDIGAGRVLRAAVGKRALEAVAALRPRQRAVDLGGAFFRHHVHRREDGIVAADNAALQVVFEVADCHCAAHAHVGVGAAAFCSCEAARNLEVHARGLV